MTQYTDYGAMRDKLVRAIKEAPTAQRELLAATDEAYEYLAAAEGLLDDASYLELKMLASQAESILTRYFGM
jgi:hypothetical protein